MVAYSFNKRFVDQIAVGTKRHTIRAFGKRRHARVGDTVQLYTAMRTKQCRKIGIARCVGFEGVMLKWSEWPSFCTFDVVEKEPGVWRREGPTRPIGDMEAFARDDGFVSLADMRQFWMSVHGSATFEGALIKWETGNG